MRPLDATLTKIIRAAFWLILIVSAGWVAWNLALASSGIQGSYRGRNGGLVPFLFFIGMGGVAALYCLGQLVSVFVSLAPDPSRRKRRRR